MRRPGLAELLSSLLFAAMLAAPAHAAVKAPEQVTEAVLANGLRIVLVPRRVSPVVSFAVTYRVGSRDEDLGETGSAHLLEHMMFKGTKQFAKGQIARLLGRNGATYNASTFPDYTNYYETYAKDRLELGFAVEASRMHDALILESERVPEMTVVRNELETDESDPASVLYSEITELAFREHAYHHPTIGYRSDIEATSAEKLRRFYEAHYQPNNAILSLVGDFDPEAALALAHRYFDPLPRGKVARDNYTPEAPQDGERRLVLDRRSETNLLEVAFHTPQVSSHDLAPLLVLDALLTNGVSSVLSQALVESDAASRVWSEVGLQRDSSLFRIGADLRPAQAGKTDHAGVEAALWRALDRLRTDLVTPEELARARRQTLAAEAYAAEGTEELAIALGSYAARDRWQRAFELRGEVNSVTAFDLNRVVKTYFTRDNATTGWWVGTPKGLVPPAPKSAEGGRAARGTGASAALPLLPFERTLAPMTQALPASRTFANGLTALVLENPGSETVALEGFVRVGSSSDPKDQHGTAEAVGYLLDSGSKTHDRVAQAHLLENVGASLSIDVQPFHTSLTGQCLAPDLELLVDALADRLRDPAFAPVEVERGLETLRSTEQQSSDDPVALAHRELARSLYPPEHPLYQRTPAEAADQLKRVTRADLMAFHRRYYGPNATTLVITGDVKAERVFAALERAFDGWAPAELVKPAAPAPLAPRRATHPLTLAGKTNVEILVGNPGPVARQDPGYFAYALANDILGGDAWASRLGAKLRDELGLTYGSYAELDADVLPGPWTTELTVNPANLDAALAALDRTLETFRQGITADELAAAKRSFGGAQVVTLGTNAGLAHAFARSALFGLGAEYWGHYASLVDAVSLEAVNAAARQLVQPDHLQTVVVGPKARRK